MNLWFDRAGLPITTEEWGRLHMIEDYLRVGSTDIGPYWVSTVWVGLDHRFIGDGPPIIFETMVFAKEQRDDPEDLGLREFDMVRYSTEEEAVAGHEAMCLLVRATTQEEISDVAQESREGERPPEEVP